MSAIPVGRPYLSTQLVAQPRVAATFPQPAARAIPRTRSKPIDVGAACGGLALACLLSLVTYLFVSLLAQVMLEQTRQEGLVAKRRATEAIRVDASLAKRLQALDNPQAIADWASAHEFKIPAAISPAATSESRSDASANGGKSGAADTHDD